MRKARLAVIIMGSAGLLAGRVLPAQSTVFRTQAKPEAVRASIMALSTSVHAGSNGEEVYLANVWSRSDPAHLAKLVDSYPPYGNPILPSLLKERRGLRMTLIRDPKCDTTGEGFFLKPGDRNLFDPDTREILKQHATDTIPCYFVVHEATRLAK